MLESSRRSKKIFTKDSLSEKDRKGENAAVAAGLEHGTDGAGDGRFIDCATELGWYMTKFNPILKSN